MAIDALVQKQFTSASKKSTLTGGSPFADPSFWKRRIFADEFKVYISLTF